MYKILGRLSATLSFLKRNRISFLHKGLKFIRIHVGRFHPFTGHEGP